ncbi:MAG: GntR family transcriptional regulator [Chloroflexi bacterium]|nr:GntR family transcriptional regulator [Chloroflexota bacterium]
MNSTEQVHKQLRNIVAERMRIAILEGRYKPGEWMRQERIAREMGVSQMPVREAIKELASEGLIEHIPYRGARVASFSLEDIQDLYEHRAFLEGRAAAIAAGWITEEELQKLKFVQTEIEQNSAPEQVGKYRELNRQFHQLIYTASRRQYLIRALNQMWSVFPTMMIANFAATTALPLPNRDATDNEEHRAIIAALDAHSPEMAEKAVKAHILATSAHLISFLKSQ